MQHARTQQILALIRSDDTAQSMFTAGKHVELAERLTDIAPPVRRSLPLSEMGIMLLYGADVETAMHVLQSIDAAAQINPVVARIARFLAPGVSAESLPDFSLPPIRQALTAPLPHGIGLTPEQAAPILRAGEQPDRFTPLEVETASNQWPPNCDA